MVADWYVVESADEKHTQTMSLPVSSTARMASWNCPTLAAEVDATFPARMAL